LPRQQAARREAAERQDARGQRVAESGLVRDRLGQRAEPDRLPRGLGHADVSITLRIYAHVLPHMQQMAVSTIEGLLGETSGTLTEALTL
ncbi:MAG TPA: hypothetical protein VGP82_20535, partial [Ktedonobacterales bacterium]|nr:hypothetical protein [Ktedonobacterales bacterium]